MTKEQAGSILNTLRDWRNDPRIFKRKSSKHYIHYTSFAGFKAMLEPYAEKNEPYFKIFPSQIQYLNDYQEYKAGVKVVGLKTDDEDNNVFAVCFCGEEDLLSQWKYYGKNSGISIEFDFNAKNPCRCKWWGKIDEVKNSDNDGLLMKPYMVFYDNHTDEYNKLYENFRLSHPESVLKSIFIPFCKDKSFHEENESRLIFYPLSDDNRKTDIKYRVTEDKIIPQFECGIAYIDNSKRNSVPIKNVMIGPGHNQILLFNAVIHMLERDKSNLYFWDGDTIDSIKKECSAVDSDLQSSRKMCVVKKHGERYYVTYKTDGGITVQLSPTPFRP